MKNILLKTFPFLSLLFLVSCFDYQTQFEGPYKDSDENIGTSLPKVIVYVADGNVYLANEFAADSVKIDNSGTVKIASINNAHTKVLFKRPNENIQIYDITAENITGEVPNTQTALWFDYHKNNQTIYYALTDDKLYTTGPEVLDHNPINLRTLSGISGNVKGVAVLENGNFVYSLVSQVSNNKYVFLSDGIGILKSYQSSSARTSFRLNPNENRLWSGNEFNSRLYYYRMPEFEQFGDDGSYKIGVPTGTQFGYRVTDFNQISSPNAPLVQSPEGQITSIDY